jgi:hypothetical protein
MRSARCLNTHSPPRLSPSLHHPRLQRRILYDYGYRHTPRPPHSRSPSAIPLASASQISARIGRIFHMSLTTFLSPSAPQSSSTPLQPHSPGGSTASAAQQYTTYDPILGRVRVCCMAALRRLRAPHRASALTSYDSRRHPHASTRCSLALITPPSPHRLRRSSGRMKSATRMCSAMYLVYDLIRARTNGARGNSSLTPPTY